MDDNWLEFGVHSGDELGKNFDARRPRQLAKEVIKKGHAFDDLRRRSDPRRKSIIPDILNGVGFVAGFLKGFAREGIDVPLKMEVRDGQRIFIQKKVPTKL